MLFQRDNDASPDFRDSVLQRAESGSDLPRWLLVLSAAAGFTLFVALLRYAIDLLGVVFVIILVGFAIRTLSDWATEGESVSAWTVSALSLGLTGTVLVGLWLFNSERLVGNRLEDALPGPFQQAVEWLEERGWGQRVLLPGHEPAASAGPGGPLFPGSSVGTAGSAGTTDSAGAESAPTSSPSRGRRVPDRAAGSGEAAAATRPAETARDSAATAAPPAARVSTTVSLSAPASSIVGRAVRLVAVVGSRAGEHVPTGEVVFSAGPTTLGRAPVRRGTATLVTLSLELGEHQLTAAYDGDDRHLPGVSARLAHQVRRQ
jgi:hypothetical protein